MEEKILAILFNMQLDIKKIENNQEEFKKEQQEIKEEMKEFKKEQQEMKEEILELRAEQQGMKLEIKQIETEQKSMRQLQDETNNKLDVLQEEIRINKINITKILEVQNKTLEFLKSTIKENEKEHKQFEKRISNLEIRKVI